MNEIHRQSARTTKRIQTVLFLIIFFMIILWSSIGSEFSLGALFAGIGNSLRFIFLDFLPPDFSVLPKLLEPAMQTLYMSLVAMVIGSIVAGLLSFLAAATTTPHPFIQVFVRAATALFRNIPVVIWTILLVAAFGLGTIVGTMSLILISIGMLTRSYAEVLEEIDMGQVEAVRAAGGSYFQVLTQAVLPQFLPGFIGWSLFNFEINIRASTIVGMVGGGGIGFILQSNLKLFQYQEASMAVVLVLAIVLLVETLTNRVRERMI
ncbi:phosphonate ABC transporter, permease protein PhnE [Paenibacillus albidus]|uniref:phosphonate ABC transporter, permease protein PhnE n=1 Tax=Paenibacillus albidus TaxID=2041023 RepID=UPI001BE503DB|nr:phosphonate ABC transporter, permease protein PhnE [Paenibacillus albidus]MBT2291367.1 phosphonate ABC transporter, permease protein PhnE [Paenibacillus albidus]